MVELFSNFTTTLVIVGVLLALGIIFEKQLIALEDKFDAYVASLRSNSAQSSKVTCNKKKAVVKKTAQKQTNRNGFAAWYLTWHFLYNSVKLTVYKVKSQEAFKWLKIKITVWDVWKKLMKTLLYVPTAVIMHCLHRLHRFCRKAVWFQVNIWWVRLSLFQL